MPRNVRVAKSRCSVVSDRIKLCRYLDSGKKTRADNDRRRENDHSTRV